MSVNVYDMVTERIIEQLKQGIVPCIVAQLSRQKSKIFIMN